MPIAKPVDKSPTGSRASLCLAIPGCRPYKYTQDSTSKRASTHEALLPYICTALFSQNYGFTNKYILYCTTLILKYQGEMLLWRQIYDTLGTVLCYIEEPSPYETYSLFESSFINLLKGKPTTLL